MQYCKIKKLLTDIYVRAKGIYILWFCLTSSTAINISCSARTIRNVEPISDLAVFD